MLRRILLADDHTLLREGLRALIAADPTIKVVGEASNGKDTVRLCVQLAPDLLMMDISMPGTNGLEALVDVKRRCPDTRVLMLTVHRSDEYVKSALAAGADGYVLKDASYCELMLAVHSVLDGKSYLSPDISSIVVNGYLAPEQTAGSVLTHREREIVQLVAEGQSNRSIASHLNLSVKTVEKHRANLMKKLDLHNASALTHYAILQGLTTPGEA